MKIVLVRPPDPMGMVDVLSHVLPTNLGYLASYLIRHGFDVEIWDYEIERFTIRDFLKRVAEASPDIVGFSCMTPTIMNGGVMASLIKEHFQHVRTVVGGAHSSALPEQTLEEFPSFDMVIVQEGELTLLEVCRRLREGQGLVGSQRAEPARLAHAAPQEQPEDHRNRSTDARHRDPRESPGSRVRVPGRPRISGQQ